MNSRCGTVHIPRVRLTCRGCGHSWLPLQAALGVGAQQRTSGGLQHWEALVGGLTIFAEAAQLLETLSGVYVGTETLRTHAEAAGTELEGEQRAAMAQVQATQEPPPGYAPVVETLVVETDGVMARYRDHHLDGTLLEGYRPADWPARPRDRNGNTLTIGASVIHASSGPSVAFNRDPGNRIGQIVGPTGTIRDLIDGPRHSRKAERVARHPRPASRKFRALSNNSSIGPRTSEIMVLGIQATATVEGGYGGISSRSHTQGGSDR